VTNPKQPKLLEFIDIRSVALPSQKLTTILELALNEKLDLDNSCDGNGTCGTCLVLVSMEDGSKLPKRNEIEQEMAADRGFLENQRLACQMYAASGMKVKIPNS
jgi:2Fe-2S ferredoxin